MTTTDHTWLTTLIGRLLSAEAVLDLCFTLGVEKEDFHGAAADYPRQLVAEVSRQGRLPVLIEQCIRLRPGAERWTPQAATRRHLPFTRNPAFTGRAALLDAIHSSLVTRHSSLVTHHSSLVTRHSSLVTHHSSLILCGLGGVGKTQLALEYAYGHWDEYDGIAWLHANDAVTLAADYVALGRRLGLPVDALTEQAAQVAAVRQWLEETAEKWLLVWDNADEADAPRALRPFLPGRGRGHLLITSRNPNWGGLAVLDVTVFTPQEAAAFLAKRTGKIDAPPSLTPDLQSPPALLAQELGYLPLALEHAAAYMEETGCDAAAYHRYFATARQRLWGKAQKPDAYHATVTTTWQIAFAEIKKEPTALALFNLCCFLAPEGIPLALLREHSDALPPELAAAAADELELDAAITPLRAYALAARAGDALAVHRLVQAVARDRLPPQLAQQWAEAAVNLTAEIFPDDPNMQHAWAAASVLLPHALAAADLAYEQRVESRRLGYLCNWLGFYLKFRAEYVAAKPYYDRALAISEKALGPDHPDVATRLNNLGMLLQATGDLGGARPYYDRALAISEKALGSDHPDVARNLNNLGLLLQAMGNLAGARPYLDRALAIWEKALGPDHPQVAAGNNNLGMLLQATGDLAGARPYLDRALAISEKALGPDHPDVARNLNNLGLLLQAMGDLAGARPYYDRALAIKEKTLGPDHPDVAQSLNNLGTLLQAMGDLAGARPYYDRALAIREKALGPSHPDVAQSLNNLGTLLQAMGDLGGARPYLDRALAIREKALGSNHPDVARSLNNLGALLYAMGDLAGARPYLDRALAIRQKSLGPDHPDVAQSLNNLGTLLQAMGDLGGAREHLQRAVTIAEDRLGPNHPNTQTVCRNLAGVEAQIK